MRGLESLPVEWANGLTIVLFLALLVLVWRIPREEVMSDAPPARWRDLRLWASALIIVQLGIYALFS